MERMKTYRVVEVNQGFDRRWTVVQVIVEPTEALGDQPEQLGSPYKTKAEAQAEADRLTALEETGCEK